MNDLLEKLNNGETVKLEREKFAAFLTEFAIKCTNIRLDLDYTEPDFVIIKKAS